MPHASSRCWASTAIWRTNQPDRIRRHDKTQAYGLIRGPRAVSLWAPWCFRGNSRMPSSRPSATTPAVRSARSVTCSPAAGQVREGGLSRSLIHRLLSQQGLSRISGCAEPEEKRAFAAEGQAVPRRSLGRSGKGAGALLVRSGQGLREPLRPDPAPPPAASTAPATRNGLGCHPPAKEQ